MNEEKADRLISRILQAAAGDSSAFYQLPGRDENADTLDAIGLAFNGLLEELRHEAEKREQDLLGWKRALHDIRGPINSILTLVSLLSRKTNESATQQVYQSIIASCNLMLGKISYAIGVQKSETERIVRINVRELVAETRAFALLPAEYLIETDEPENFILYSDRILMASIFKNLIENAYKYRRPEIPGVLLVRARNSNSLAEIEFIDNGIGIADENIKRIFQMHTQVSERHEGLGYGLYSVKRDVETLQGEILVNSVTGSGTTMTLRFSSMFPDSMMRNFSAARDK